MAKAQPDYCTGGYLDRLFDAEHDLKTLVRECSALHDQIAELSDSSRWP